MTEVSFHVHIAHAVSHSMAVLRKAWQQYPKVALAGPQPLLQEVSTALMAQSPSAFVPHCWATQPHAAQEAGCLVLLPPQEMAQLSPAFDCLLTWGQGAEPAEGFARFARVVELVGCDEADLAQARLRWQFYQHRGYPLTMHKRPSAPTR